MLGPLCEFPIPAMVADAASIGVLSRAPVHGCAPTRFSSFCGIYGVILQSMEKTGRIRAFWFGIYGGMYGSIYGDGIGIYGRDGLIWRTTASTHYLAGASG